MDWSYFSTRAKEDRPTFPSTHKMNSTWRLSLCLGGVLLCLTLSEHNVRSSDASLLRHRALHVVCLAESELQSTIVEPDSYHKCKYYDSHCNVEEDACSGHGQCSADGTHCQCHPGYVQEDNNVNECRGVCQDPAGEYFPSESIRECAFYDADCHTSDESCSGHGQCEENGTQCQCDSGYVQEKDNPIECRGKCQDSSGFHFPSDSVHECAHYDSNCQVQSEPICSDQGTCGPNGEVCQCNAGYVHDNGDPLTCRGKCQSQQGTYFPSNSVHACDFFDDDCRGSSEGPCSGHGDCADGTCSCANGYEVDPATSWRCQGKCEDESGRFPSNSVHNCVFYDSTCNPVGEACEGTGTCNSNGSCTCDPGYEEFTSAHGVSSCRGVCVHKGQHIPPGTRMGCEYINEDCQVTECGGHGTCSEDGQSCVCENGYLERSEHVGECKGKCATNGSFAPPDSYFKCTYYDGQCSPGEECGGFGTCNDQDVCSCDWNADAGADNPYLCVARCEDSKGTPYGDITITERSEALGNWEESRGPHGGGWKFVRKDYCGANCNYWNHDYLFEGTQHSFGFGPCTYGLPEWQKSDYRCSLDFEDTVPGWNQIALVSDGPEHAWFITTKEDFLRAVRESAHTGRSDFREAYSGHGMGLTQTVPLPRSKRTFLQITVTDADRPYCLWEGLPDGEKHTRSQGNDPNNHILRHIYIRKVC